jgi:hypothetical protein
MIGHQSFGSETGFGSAKIVFYAPLSTEPKLELWLSQYY